MSKKKQPEQAETEQTEAKQASEEKTEQPAEAKTPAADWEAKYNDCLLYTSDAADEL